MILANKKVLVVGAARTGLAVTRFLLNRGAQVTLADFRPAETIDLTIAPEVECIFGQLPSVYRNRWDMAVVSPGVPLNSLLVRLLRQAETRIIGELELAAQFIKTPYIAVTGTNGKTTTVTLLGELFKNAGYRTLVAGNIGTPLVDQIDNYGPEDIVVLEVSSFQLETVNEFCPFVAVILNITPDHLDRHGNMQCYVEAKARIFARQKKTEYTVLNNDDPIVAQLADRAQGNIVFFSAEKKLCRGTFISEGQIMMAENGKAKTICSVASVKLPGKHNLENILAATAVAQCFDVNKEVLAHTFKNFAGVPHRLQRVGEVNGVIFINDSKATNPDAAIKGLEAYPNPLLVIAGGRNKGNSFAKYLHTLRRKAKLLIVMGECADELQQEAAVAGVERVIRVESMKEAVRAAYSEALIGDVVLLSPACASWDMYRNYEERGEDFKRVVNALARGFAN